MARRRRWLTLALVAAAALIGIVEVETLVETLRTHSDFRQKLIAKADHAAAAAQPAVAERLKAGGPGVLEAAVVVLLRETQAAEAAVLDGMTGAVLLARPESEAIPHRLDARQLSRVRSGTILTVGPFLQDPPRLLTYFPAAADGKTVVMRFSTPIPELAAFLGERRQLLVAHGAAIALLLIAVVIALRPSRSPDAEESPGPLEAYEAAMERLRDHTQALARDHEAERRRMEGQIRDKEAMARAGELAAGITHEVRNGLATILGYARLLEQQSVAPEQADAARGILGECQALETVIRRLLDYVKSETLNLSSFDLTRMLQRVSSREARDHPETTVAVNDGEVAVVGDEELLERAFENLVRNALEAAGGQVWVTIKRDEPFVSVTIADDGAGMTEEALAQLRPFYTTKPSGTGLGLPLALKIVLLHDGEVKLAPRNPRGLEVRVRLPAVGPR